MEFKFIYWAPLIVIAFFVLLLVTSNNGLGIGIGLTKLREGLTSENTQQTTAQMYTDVTNKIKNAYQPTATSLDKYRTNMEDVLVTLANYSEYGMILNMWKAAGEAQDPNKPLSENLKKLISEAEQYKKLREISEDCLNYMDKN